MNEAKDNPTFKIGQKVKVILNENNRTQHLGTIVDMIWHHKDECYHYFLEDNGKKVSKRYMADDLEALM